LVRRFSGWADPVPSSLAAKSIGLRCSLIIRLAENLAFRYP